MVQANSPGMVTVHDTHTYEPGSCKESISPVMLNVSFYLCTCMCDILCLDCLMYDLMLQGRYWIMNPIDGLEGFENLRQYGISLALLADGKVWLNAAHQQIHDSYCSHVNVDNACHLAV